MKFLGTLQDQDSKNVDVDGHAHAISETTGLQAALDAKLTATAYTASDVLTKLKTVDGTGSGLDADLLDGLDSTAFVKLTGSTMTGGLVAGYGGTSDHGISSTPSMELGINAVRRGFLKLQGYTSGAYGVVQMTTNNLHIDAATGGATYLNFYQGNAGVMFGNGGGSAIVAKMDINGQLWNGNGTNKYWHAGNDGAGSGLDADTLDGLSSASFAKNASAITLAQLNSITLDPGFYSVEGLAISGLPSTYTYIIQLATYTGGGYKSQVAVPFDNGTNQGMYMRVSVASVWGNWEKIAKFSDIPTTLPASDVYAWAKASVKPVYTATEVGLGSVNNTADSAKPVSTAQQTALNLKAPLASPALTGTPTAPTATTTDNSTQIATTAFVKAQGYITSSGSGAKITTASAAPTSPGAGDFWYKIL